MSSILSGLRKLSDKLFGAAFAEGGVIGKPLTAEERQAAIGAYMQAHYPSPYAPHPKEAEERAHRNKNTAPDPLMKANNASCGAETSEGASAPSDQTGMPLDVLLIAREAEAIDNMDKYPAYADEVRRGGCDGHPVIRVSARAILMDRAARSARREVFHCVNAQEFRAISRQMRNEILRDRMRLNPDQPLPERGC